MRDVPLEIAEAIERAISSAPEPDDWQLAVVANNLRPVVEHEVAERELVNT